MLRLLADDLTGALDSAAPFVGRFGPIPTYWDETAATAGSLALDGETRDLEPDRARERIAALAPSSPAPTSRSSRSTAACAATRRPRSRCARGTFRTVVIAPAFPAQGRITRQGRQLVRDASGTWQPVPLDLPAALAAAGLPVRLGPPESGSATLCDAETDDDLARIAATPGLEPPILWCGTGGLARALAGATPPQLVLDPPAIRPDRRPARRTAPPWPRSSASHPAPASRSTASTSPPAPRPRPPAPRTPA